MKTVSNGATSSGRKIAGMALVSALIFVIGSGAAWGAPALGSPSSAPPSSPLVTCPAGQCFADVDGSNSFFTYINNLYEDGIVGGYACGGAGEPCDANSRPYYRPGLGVTRQAMAKFIDLGRRNIADAVGTSLNISSTAVTTIQATTNSGGQAVWGRCFGVNNNCWAVRGYGAAGNYAGAFLGGRGVQTSSEDSTYAGVDARTSGSTAYGGRFESSLYRGAYAKSDSTVLYSMYVDSQGGPTQATAALNVVGTARIEGNLVVAGSKTGFVVDIMQNAGSQVLEAGDVVSISGSSPAVIGQIPVVTVRKASTAYDTGVTGVVDQVVYVPSARMRADYEAQEKAIREAQGSRNALMKSAAGDSHIDPSAVAMPEAKITDAEGTVHADASATAAGTGQYINVVTLGAYKAVKVDASFGAIHAGDLLTSSSHAGYAMKASDRAAANGAVIGKALGDLVNGTGNIPVLVTLK